MTMAANSTTARPSETAIRSLGGLDRAVVVSALAGEARSAERRPLKGYIRDEEPSAAVADDHEEETRGRSEPQQRSQRPQEHAASLSAARSRARGRRRLIQRPQPLETTRISVGPWPSANRTKVPLRAQLTAPDATRHE